MRGLAMPFAGMLLGGGIGKVDGWLRDAQYRGLHARGSFVGELRLDTDAVRNAIREVWSTCQINRLTTLKRNPVWSRAC